MRLQAYMYLEHQLISYHYCSYCLERDLRAIESKREQNWKYLIEYSQSLQFNAFLLSF